MKRFENKVALVTGGRSGIGGATAKRLRDEGATVITAQRGTNSDFPSISVDFEDMTLDDWMRTINVNLTAPFLLIKSALSHLRKTKGAIVNTGSIEGLGSNPMHAAYGASKAGLHGLTKAIAVDHGKDGIRCNAVAPGWIDTDLNEDYIDNMPDPDAFRRDIAKIHPVGSTGKPQDVAALIAFLASDDAAAG